MDTCAKQVDRTIPHATCPLTQCRCANPQKKELKPPHRHSGAEKVRRSLDVEGLWRGSEILEKLEDTPVDSDNEPALTSLIFFVEQLCAMMGGSDH